MLSVDRWSLYGGALVQLKWATNQPILWSLQTGDLYVQMVFTEGLLYTQGHYSWKLGIAGDKVMEFLVFVTFYLYVTTN